MNNYRTKCKEGNHKNEPGILFWKHKTQEKRVKLPSRQSMCVKRENLLNDTHTLPDISSLFLPLTAWTCKCTDIVISCYNQTPNGVVAVGIDVKSLENA